VEQSRRGLGGSHRRLPDGRLRIAVRASWSAGGVSMPLATYSGNLHLPPQDSVDGGGKSSPRRRSRGPCGANVLISLTSGWLPGPLKSRAMAPPPRALADLGDAHRERSESATLSEPAGPRNRGWASKSFQYRPQRRPVGPRAEDVGKRSSPHRKIPPSTPWCSARCGDRIGVAKSSHWVTFRAPKACFAKLGRARTSAKPSPHPPRGSRSA